MNPTPLTTSVRDRVSSSDILDTMEQFGDLLNTSSADEAVSIEEGVGKSEANYSDWEALPSEPDTPGESPTNSYSAEFERLFRRPGYLKQLRHKGLTGQLRSCRFRSVCWRVYLEVLSEDVETWQEETRRQREEYNVTREKLLVDPHKEEVTRDPSRYNPLSTDEESPWTQYFADLELKATIHQDVVRTFPDLQVFRAEIPQELLSNVLFCYAKLNPTVCYKQGMHELLAPLVFVLYSDHQAFRHAREMGTLSPVLEAVLDPQYLEHDAYALFCNLMQSVESWYLYDAQRPRASASSKFTTSPTCFTEAVSEEESSSAIVRKLSAIEDNLLKRNDLELYLHLKSLDIAPQIYGIRWLRLLFGREFPIQDLLVVWDTLFAESRRFVLADYVFVAMLMYIRETLVLSDYPEALNLLMRYPPVGDVFYILQQARHMHSPKSTPCPPAYIFHRLSPVTDSLQGHKQLPHVIRSPRKGSHVTRSLNNNTVKPAVNDTRVKSAVNDTRPQNEAHARADKTRSVSGLSSLAKRLAPRARPSTRQGLQHPAAWDAGDHAPGGAEALPVERRGLARLSSSDTDRQPYVGRVEEFSVVLPPGGKPTKRTKSLEHKTEQLQLKLDQAAVKEDFCASKLETHISEIQDELMARKYDEEDKILVALAGIKQVRDILQGTLRFSSDLLGALSPSSSASSDLRLETEVADNDSRRE